MTKNGVDTKLAVLVEKVTNIESKVNKIENRLDAEFVTRGEMEAKIALLESNIVLLQKIVYGVVGVILTSVVGTIMLFVLNKP